MSTYIVPGAAQQPATQLRELTTGGELVSSSNPLQVVLEVDTVTIGGVEIVDSGGTNKLAIDSSGRLTLIPNSSVNLAQYAGVAPTLDNTSIPAFSMRGKGTVAGDTPLMLELTGALAGGVVPQDMIRRATIAGYAYSACTGKLTAPGAGTFGFQLLAPASNTKNILIYSLVVIQSAAGIHQMMKTAINVNTITGWATNDVAATITNNGASATASTATASYSNANVTGTLLGNAREVTGNAGNTPQEILTNGECIWLPAGAGAISGFALYLSDSGANPWGVTCEYLEF